MRTSIGFENLLDTFEKLAGESVKTYPPYNVLRTGENQFALEVAVAGFAPDELDIERVGSKLQISGSKAESDRASDNTTYLVRNLASRNFSLSFSLAPHVQVTQARVEHGILYVQMERETPEELKPRKIAIASDTQTDASKDVDAPKDVDQS